MQTKQLEESLGWRFLNNSASASTSPRLASSAGLRAFVTQQLDELEGVLNRMKGLGGGRLRISVATTANYFIPTLLGSFSRRYPDVTVSLDVTNRETLLRQLNENTVDLVVMGQPPAEADVEAQVFMDNPLVWSPRRPPVGEGKEDSARAAPGRTFLVRESGSGTRIAMERFFNERACASGPAWSGLERGHQAVRASGPRARSVVTRHHRAGIGIATSCGARCRRIPHHASLVRGAPQGQAPVSGCRGIQTVRAERNCWPDGQRTTRTVQK